MRKSLQDIASMLRSTPYHSPLPDDIKHLHYYITDSGHCILAVPTVFLDKAASDPMDYEVPLPVRYVLEKGWKPIPGTDSISVDVVYDDIFGAMVPEEYDEW